MLDFTKSGEWDSTGDVLSDLSKMAHHMKLLQISPPKPLQINVRNEDESNRVHKILGNGNYEIWITKRNP